MVTIKANISLVSNSLLEKLRKIKDREYLLRPVAFDVITLMTDRIHQQGKASDGSQIGTYSNNYLYKRKKNNRGTDKKIIVSLTRQLENDWSVIATPKGYGIGFLNAFNLSKARWVEEGKGKKIFSLSESESEYAITKLQELTRDALNS